MMEDYKLLQEFVDKMKNTSKTNEKKEIIKEYIDNEFISLVLYYTYNEFLQFGVTSKGIEKHPELECDADLSLKDILDLLESRTITGHKAIGYVNSYINKHTPYKPLIYGVIDKNIEIRANASLINKVKPGLIPTFDVALADKYEPTYCNFDEERWYASRKLDGVRCVIIVDEYGKATSWSRQGKQFHTVSKVEKVIERIGVTNVVFDGELCIMKPDGSDDFTSIVSQVRRKDHTIDNPKFKIFDYLPLSDFTDKKSDMDLTVRLQKLNDLLCPFSDPEIEILHQEIVTSQEVFDRWMKTAKDNGWEGFMVRKDCEYEGKRTKRLLKVKKFFDDEYIVKDVEFDDHRIIQDGKEIKERMLANVIVEHKGYEVSVGSGWSHEQRRQYYQNPNEIIGKTITVQYFEETTNKEGTISLRFPTVKHVYNNGRNC